jgi:hypothetical protein
MNETLPTFSTQNRVAENMYRCWEMNATALLHANPYSWVLRSLEARNLNKECWISISNSGFQASMPLWLTIGFNTIQTKAFKKHLLAVTAVVVVVVVILLLMADLIIFGTKIIQLLKNIRFWILQSSWLLSDVRCFKTDVLDYLSVSPSRVNLKRDGTNK